MRFHLRGRSWLASLARKGARGHRAGLLGQTNSMFLAVLSGRYDRLIWGVVAVLAAFVLSRLTRGLVAGLAARHPDEERELSHVRRVDIDPGVIISGLLSPAGPPGQIMAAVGLTRLRFWSASTSSTSWRTSSCAPSSEAS